MAVENLQVQHELTYRLSPEMTTSFCVLNPYRTDSNRSQTREWKNRTRTEPDFFRACKEFEPNRCIW